MVQAGTFYVNEFVIIMMMMMMEEMPTKWKRAMEMMVSSGSNWIINCE